MLHGGGLVAGNAGVVAVVVGRQVVDAQRAGEVDVVHGHAQAGRDGPAVLLPGDVQRPVPRHDHAGDEDALADGEALELEGLDVGRHCGGGEGEDGRQRSNMIPAAALDPPASPTGTASFSHSNPTVLQL